MLSAQSFTVFGWPSLFMVLAFFSTTNTIEANCIVSCKSSLNISLGIDGQAVLTTGILLQDPTCNPSEFTIEISDLSGNQFGNLLDCSMIGQLLIATVTHISTGNYCESNITVGDHFRPSIFCRDTTILCIESTDPADMGFPTVMDNCSTLIDADLSYDDEFTDLACYATNGTDSITSMIIRTWTVADESGNTNQCTQTIYLKRATINDVVFPAHRDGFASPALDCSEDPKDLSITGEPTINGRPITNNGNCELVISHSDQQIAGCSPGAFRILRTWTAIDWCSGAFLLNVQIIKVKDTTPPTLICPADITVSTDVFDCTATINLPVATASDNCSNISITPSWAYGSGFGPFTNVAQGDYEITYTATDGCGNETSCIIQLSVIDDVAPVTVCDLATQVDLSTDGVADVFAISFDDGSHDNCGLDRFEASRDGINYGPRVRFDCNDTELGLIPVWMRVYDLEGNFNECQVSVEVVDRARPAIFCPSTVYIECTDDAMNLLLTGEPLVNDNCGVDTVFYSDQVFINDCGVGTISRRWTVRDLYGNETPCTQLIVVEDYSPISVFFPDDFITTTCNAGTDPDTTGSPIVIGAQCESMWVNYTDEVFEVAENACFKIFRTWKVINWCVYDPNSGTNEGLWEDVQLISVIDEDAPTIFCPADTLAASFSADCSGVFIQLDTAMAVDCHQELTITNDSPFAIANEADATGTYPVGNHTITFTATDGCGNSSNCSMVIIVEDAKPPTPICKGGISVSLSFDGTVTILPETLDNGSSDNCSAAADLTYEVVPSIFTCDDLGEQTVEFIITDEAGNQAICTSIVFVQDGIGICPQANIGGTILTEKGIGLSFVEVDIAGSDIFSIENDAATGSYEFVDLPKGESYVIEPSKDTNHRNGLTTFDIIIMSRHILGIQSLPTPYRIIAADVNRSGTVTTFDMVELRRLILQLDTKFRRNTSWRFVREDFVFSNQTNPFTSTFPETYIIENLNEDILDANFIAIKTGDVNVSANPAIAFDGESEDRSDIEPFKFSIDNVELEAGKYYEIPVSAMEFEEIYGFQFGLEYDTDKVSYDGIVLTEKAIEVGLKEEYFASPLNQTGLISSSWANAKPISLPAQTKLFTLRFRAKKTSLISEVLSFDNRNIQAEAYQNSEDAEDIRSLKTMLTFLDIFPPKEEPFLQAELFQNFPNPCKTQTTFSFNLPQPSYLRIVVYDAAGKRLNNLLEGHFEAGSHQQTISRSIINLASGVYFYRLEAEEWMSEARTLVVQ